MRWWAHLPMKQPRPISFNAMFAVLANRTYRHLFAAQVIALLGSGLATVALGLMAWRIAGDNAGAVLGTALAIKMVAYVLLAPVAGALASQVPRRVMLVGLDVLRALVALCLPFVSEAWQVYLLIFLLQAASAGFTPVFQATIPDVLPDDEDYTNALSLSRFAYDLEALLSPVLAAALLSVVSFPTLFFGTVLGFLLSAALVLSVSLPAQAPDKPRRIWERTFRGSRIYLATPRLRGVLALSMVVAAVGSMVIVNTVVIVQQRFGLGEQGVALALAAFGGGSMLSAFALPPLLRHFGERRVMFGGAGLLTAGCLAGALVGHFSLLLALWFALGFGFGITQTPIGRLLRRSAQSADIPALFAAQFSLSHGCWLVAYLLAGRFGAGFGLSAAFALLSLLSAGSMLLALRMWRCGEDGRIVHSHPELPQDHPHLSAHGSGPHVHEVVIDDLHPCWPTQRPG